MKVRRSNPIQTQIHVDNQKKSNSKIPDIIFLLGTSTAGKSTIVNEVKKLDPERYITGVDITSDELTLEWMNKHFPEEYKQLIQVIDKEDIQSAVFASKFQFKEGTNPEIQELAKKNAKHIFEEGKAFSDELNKENNEKLLVRNVANRVKNGQDCILDVVPSIKGIFSKFKESQINANIRIALAYCPFEELSNRMEIRNKKAVESGNLGDRRVGPFPFHQFAKLFKKTTDGLNVIGNIDKETVERIYNKNFDDAVAKGLLKETEKMKKLSKIINKLGFTDSDNAINLAPKLKVDYILNTSKLTPLESAKIILK